MELKAGDKIKVRIYDVHHRTIKTKNYDEIFTVREENGKLGIDWVGIFTPFDSFCNTEFLIVPTELIELENLLNAECEKYENDCSKCPYKKECEKYCKLSGI